MRLEVLIVAVGISHSRIAHPEMLLTQVAQAWMIDSPGRKVRYHFSNFFRKRAVAVLFKIPVSDSPTASLGMRLRESSPFNNRGMIVQRENDLAHLTKRFADECFPSRIEIRKHINRTILIKWELENFQNSQSIA